MATTTREWIQFFKGCGIPGNVAATYALIFHKNRIQKSMLLDLNKEYLNDMGITATGDLIAILKYARTNHEKYISNKLLKATVNLDTSISNKTLNNSTSSKKTITAPKKSEDPKERISHEILDQAMRSVSPAKPSEGRAMKPSSEAAERPRKLLKRAQLKRNATVFERLEGTFVKKTTSEISIEQADINVENSNSVFTRLGEKTSLTASTSHTEIVPFLKESVKGLKITPSSERSSAIKRTSSSNGSIGAQNVDTKSGPGKSVKDRLGLCSNQTSSTLKMETSIKKDTIVLKRLKKNHDDEDIRKLNLTDQNFQKLPTTSSTTAVTEDVKRKMQSSDSEIIKSGEPLKKIRFGGISQRLIPARDEDQVNPDKFKKYPKLTMTIQNDRCVVPKNEVNKLPSDVKIEPSRASGLRSEKLPYRSKQSSFNYNRQKKLSLHERLGFRSKDDRHPN